MHAAAVVSGDRTCWSAQIDRARHIESVKILVVQCTSPFAGFVIKVVQRSVVAIWDDSHGRHVIGNIVQVYPQRKHLVVGMRPKLNVLMPPDLFAAAAPFKVQFGVMKFYVRAK